MFTEIGLILFICLAAIYVFLWLPLKWSTYKDIAKHTPLPELPKSKLVIPRVKLPYVKPTVRNLEYVHPKPITKFADSHRVSYLPSTPGGIPQDTTEDDGVALGIIVNQVLTTDWSSNTRDSVPEFTSGNGGDSAGGGASSSWSSDSSSSSSSSDSSSSSSSSLD